jgi:hypothetical protein
MEDNHRDKLERWLDRHNHELELIRTILNLASLIIGTLVLLRVFGYL